MIKLDDVLDRISTKEGLAYYGVVFNKKNFTNCPFHREKTPSFHYNEKTDRYYCFSCGKGGNIVNFVAESFGYNLPKDLPRVLEKINVDFHLNLDAASMSKKERYLYEQEQQLNEKIVDAEDRWKEELSKGYDFWTTVHRNLFRASVYMDEEDPELIGFIEKLDAYLNDFTGNAVRELSLESFTPTEIQWIKQAMKDKPVQVQSCGISNPCPKVIDKTMGREKTITKDIAMD